jgi:thymidylate kinase
VKVPDNVGKGTQIQLLKRYLEENDQLLHVLHYSNIKGKDVYQRSQVYYQQMFMLCEYALSSNISLILDRAHLGETVYSPLYRNYNGDYVFELERDLIKHQGGYHLVVFIADPETLVHREDGFSFSKDLEAKRDEIDRFVNAYNKSTIKNKHLIDITNKDVPTVWKELQVNLTLC